MIHAIRGRPQSGAGGTWIAAWCTSTFKMPSMAWEHMNRLGLVAEICFRTYVRLILAEPDNPELWPPELQTRQDLPTVRRGDGPGPVLMADSITAFQWAGQRR